MACAYGVCRAFRTRAIDWPLMPHKQRRAAASNSTMNKRRKTTQASEAARRDNFLCHVNKCLHNFFVNTFDKNGRAEVSCEEDADLGFHRYVCLDGKYDFSCCPHDANLQRVMHQYFKACLPFLANQIASYLIDDVGSVDPSALFSANNLHVCIKADVSNSTLRIISASVARIDSRQWSNICALLKKS